MHRKMLQELLLVQQGQSNTSDCCTNAAMSKHTVVYGRLLKTVSGACYLQLHRPQEQHEVCVGRREAAT